MKTDGGSGETVSFVFTGLDVTVVGAKRREYGQYQITVNDKQYPAREGSNDPELFQTTLFNFSWPAHIDRTLKMASIGNNKAVDLDFVSWTMRVGDDNDDEEVITSTFEDNHPSFKYDTNWGGDLANTATYSGGSAHVASTIGSTFEFTFEGDAISLFGPVGPSGGAYTVLVDTDGLPTDLTTRKPTSHPKTMLYHKCTLGPGTHKLTLFVRDDGGGQTNSTFAIDYAEVYTAPSIRGSAAGAVGSSSKLSNGDVAGIVAGGFIGLLLLLGLVFLVLAQRARKRGRTFHIGFLEKERSTANQVRPFQYTDASPPISPPGTSSGERLLQNQVSFASISSSPMTSQLSPSAATMVTAATGYDSARPISMVGPNTQEVTVPPRGYEKSRGVLLQAPPQGARTRGTPAADGAAGQTVSPVVEEHQTIDPPPPMYTMDTPAPSSVYSR